MEPTVFV